MSELREPRQRPCRPHRPGREQEEATAIWVADAGRGFALFGSGLCPCIPQASHVGTIVSVSSAIFISFRHLRRGSCRPRVRQVTPCSEEAAALVSQVKMALLRRGGPSGAFLGPDSWGLDDLDNIVVFCLQSPPPWLPTSFIRPFRVCGAPESPREFAVRAP